AHAAAAEVSRTQPGRERLAVHARQLAFEPHLQILRRYRRSLLLRLEPPCRSALAHHVPWHASLGPWVMINETWYSTFSPSHRSPAKAGVHAKQRCAIWPPAFAGEQLLTCLKAIYAHQGRVTRKPKY